MMSTTGTDIRHLRNDILSEVTLITLNAHPWQHVSHLVTRQPISTFHCYRQFTLGTQEEDLSKQTQISLIPRLRMIDGEKYLVPQVDCRISSSAERREEVIAELLKLQRSLHDIALPQPANNQDIEHQISKLDIFTERLCGLYEVKGYKMEDNGTGLHTERFESEGRMVLRQQRHRTHMFTMDNFSTVGGLINPQGQLKYTFGLMLDFHSGANGPTAVPFAYTPSEFSNTVCDILKGLQADADNTVFNFESVVRHSRSLDYATKFRAMSHLDQDAITATYRLTLLNDESVQTPLMVPINQGARAFDRITRSHIESVRDAMQLAIAKAEHEEGSEMEAFRGWKIEAIQLDMLNFQDLNESMADAQVEGGEIPYSIL